MVGITAFGSCRDDEGKREKTMDEVRFLTAGDAAVVVEFGKTINEAVSRRVGAFSSKSSERPPQPTYPARISCSSGVA